MGKLLVILGPTSTGKTDLALELAKKFKGELISCDSRQVYTSLDIGTGKMPGKKVKVEKSEGFWKLDEIKVWMYDVIDFKRQYTVYDYVQDAGKVINNILSRGKLPIVVGGTGLYLKALLDGLPNLSIPVDQNLRKNLGKLPLEKLQKKLQKISFQKWMKMNYSDQQNPRRLIRAIELAGVTLSIEKMPNFNSLKIGLSAERNILYKKIDERVVKRINQGMIEEAENLHKKGLSIKRMRQLGLEYSVLADYLEGKIREQDLTKIIQNKIHGFARRQITWFKKEKEVTWFDVTDKNYIKKIDKLTSKWYDTRCAT